jgi:3-deoxy-D-manno-octulosonic-acid transferase
MLLRARARRGKEDPSRMGERLGRTAVARPSGRLAWLHGVSVGESLSLLPVVERLAGESPEVAILVTSGTSASGDVLRRRLPRTVIHQYVPLDTPGAVDAFLDHWRPDLGVIVESELWPNLLLGAAARGAKLALVSARLSEQSYRAWRRAPGAARAMFATFDLVLARDAAAAGRLRGLGARIDGVADLKLGAPPLPVDDREFDRFRATLGERPVILAASTHPGEEAAALDGFIAAKGGRQGALLIIAPRHAERGPMIAELAQERGLTTILRSRQADPADAEVYVADTVGETGLWYRLARLAFMGGSLAAGLGGHNPLEPARLGCPIVSGDKTDNWPIYRDLAQVGAAILVEDASHLEPAFRAALEGGDQLSAMARKARDYVAGRDAESAAAITRVLALLNR